MIQDANDFLNSGGGAPAAKFPTIGTVVRGTIVDAEVQDQTDFETGEALVWQDGKPRKQLIITVDTGIVDGDDDGNRRLFAKGNMLTAIREAVKPHGELAVGGKLAVKYSDDGVASKRGFNPPKLFKATYEPPAKTVAVDSDDLF